MSNNMKNLSPWLDKLPFEWQVFMDKGKYRHVSKGEHVFHNEDDLKSVFIVISGRMRLYLNTANGKEKTIAIIGQNGLLGEQFLTSHESHITSAIAVSDSYILEIDKMLFMKLVLEDRRLTIQWLEILSMKLELLIHASLKLSYESSLKNIANAFIELANIYGEIQGTQIKITITFTHQELADLIGMTRVTVSKTMKVLYEMHLIQKKDRHYYINDIEKLKEVL